MGMSQAYRRRYPAHMPARRPMTPEDIRRIVVVEELDLSTDGRLAVVVRRSIKGDRYHGHLFAIDLDRGNVRRPRRLTRGAVRDTWPRLCSDGRTLAFVRTDPGDEDALARIGLLDLARPGTPVRLAGRGDHGAVTEVAWSPDGRRLAFTAVVDPPRFIVGPTTPAGRRSPRANAKRAAAETPAPRARHITRADWRWDGEGHRDRWWHLFVVDWGDGRPRQVTSGDWGVSDIAWHPDGRSIAFAADRGPEADRHPRTTIWAVDVDDAPRLGAGRDPAPKTAGPREILAAGGWANHPAWSPDGRWIAAIGVLEPEPLDDVMPDILIGPADGSRPPHALDPELDRAIGNWTDTDLNGWMVSGRHGPAWVDDRHLVATVSDRGRSHPHVYTIDSTTGRLVERTVAATGDLTTHTLAVAPTPDSAGRPRIAFLATNGVQAMDLYTTDGPDPAHLRRRSTFGSRWQDRHPMPEMRRLDVPGPGGPIETWIASPPDAGDKALPTVVDVHGGPLGAWAPAPHVEVFLLVAAGYRVMLPNIRGSATYGRDWIRPQLGDWGGVDAADVHAAVDHVVALGLADPERLGVFGLSYGGFMVNWLVGTTDRFKAAVSENGVTNQIASWANSDSGPEYDRASLLGNPFSPEGIERLWRQSPLRNVASVRTPLLMLQAESDLRCPAQDNEQLFVALRQLGREVEYVLYPEESHTYASAGRPDRRIDRMTRMIDWFDRHLR
jgi:dipeptidyl aminopeptidase/acylaminoacyl peptidase